MHARCMHACRDVSWPRAVRVSFATLLAARYKLFGAGQSWPCLPLRQHQPQHSLAKARTTNPKTVLASPLTGADCGQPECLHA